MAGPSRSGEVAGSSTTRAHQADEVREDQPEDATADAARPAAEPPSRGRRWLPTRRRVKQRADGALVYFL